MAFEVAFVDTNVFVYAFDRDEPVKQTRALDILEHRPVRSLVTSAQVLGEFFNTVTRKLTPPLSTEEAHRQVRKLVPLAAVAVDRELVLRAIELHIEKSISYWDAMIVGAAARIGCDVVLTEDLNDGEVIAGIRVVNPFVVTP